MLLSGISPDSRLVEIVELKDHPWFVASQFHPEFKSRPERPHPLFHGFVATAIALQQGTEPRLTAVGPGSADEGFAAPDEGFAAPDEGFAAPDEGFAAPDEVSAEAAPAS
jgi:Glutamine amidotransferase class-I